MFEFDLSPTSLLLIVLVVILLCVVIVTTIRYKWQQHRIRQQQAIDRDVERDNYTCQICGISRDFLDELCPGLGDYLLLEADHIQSVKRGGTGKDIDNLQCLCWRCNRKKGGNKTNKDVRAEIDYGIWYLKE